MAFALVRVGDLLGADIGPRGRDRTETGVGWSSGVQVDRWIKESIVGSTVGDKQTVMVCLYTYISFHRTRVELLLL